WTIVYALGLAGAAATVAKTVIALPYLLPIIFGTYAVYNVVKCVKNCVQAFWSWRHKKMDECKAHLWNAAKQLLSAAVNVLAVVTSFTFGVQMTEAANKLTDFSTFEEGKKLILDCWNTGSTLLYAMTATATLSFVATTTRMNTETFNVLRHPIDSAKKAYYAFKANPVDA